MHMCMGSWGGTAVDVNHKHEIQIMWFTYTLQTAVLLKATVISYAIALIIFRKQAI